VTRAAEGLDGDHKGAGAIEGGLQDGLKLEELIDVALLRRQRQ
jgi:hypothetical protein